ncbi:MULTISPECIES: helix-turn-helix domain-containing protein [unclassified Streptomyces]|uniref:helix-turn-helix domain-containing protein n=1 Tax=unclassified Streptomyces TaxID=2593676 RepID=UPI0013714065|nr:MULTISPECIES: XRE family transcriptional regulator [unclassified Streptomyces]MCW5251464.1 helix-turn-helix transcriptional regulator [Streptomyces sp. SHP 1-2]MYU22467.1 helix-turn-helix domain-containing protein [Streptomyces sp. SID8352]
MDHNDPSAVGRTIRSLRVRQGITMVHLAGRAGISQSYLSEIETGKASPSLTTLFALAEQLGMTPAGLLRPPVREDEIAVVRAGEAADAYPVSDTTGHVRFRAVLRHGPLSVSEFAAAPGDDLTGDFSHSGYEAIYVAHGSLNVTLAGREPVLLTAGDTMSYPGEIPHSWQVAGTGPVRVLQVLDTPAAHPPH